MSQITNVRWSDRRTKRDSPLGECLDVVRGMPVLVVSATGGAGCSQRGSRDGVTGLLYQHVIITGPGFQVRKVWILEGFSWAGTA